MVSGEETSDRGDAHFTAAKEQKGVGGPGSCAEHGMTQ